MEPRVKSIPEFREPTPEERLEVGRRWFERAGATFLDRWPPALSALAPATVLIPWPAGEIDNFYEFDRGDPPWLAGMVRQIDEACGWNEKFIRLNSRSPKDAAPSTGPCTCSGKQALHWIRGSERCLDDLVLFEMAGEPAFVAVRDRLPGSPDWEVRMFLRDGELIGAAQYTRPQFRDPFAGGVADKVMPILQSYCRDTLGPALHLRDVVVDVMLLGRDVRLLEINPYGLSDPVAAKSYQNIEANPGAFHRYDDATQPLDPAGLGQGGDARGVCGLPRVTGGDDV